MALDDNQYALGDALQTLADAATMRLREYSLWGAELLQRTNDPTALLVQNDGAIRFKVHVPMEATADTVPTRQADTLLDLTPTPRIERDDVFGPNNRVYVRNEFAWSRAAAGVGPDLAETVLDQAEAVGNKLNDRIFDWLELTASAFWPAHGAPAISIAALANGDIFRIAGIKRRFKFPRGVLPEVWLDAEFAEAANDIDQFNGADKRGDGPSRLIRMAEFPDTYGARFMWDDRILSHTAGTAAGDPLVLSANVQIDSPLMEISGSVTGNTLEAGDLFSFAGDDVGRVVAHPDRYDFGKPYTYTADGAGAFSGVRFHPAPDATVVSTTALNLIGDYRYLLMFVPQGLISAQFAYRTTSPTYAIRTARDIGTPTQPGTGITGNLVFGSRPNHSDFVDFVWMGGMMVRQPNWVVKVRITT